VPPDELSGQKEATQPDQAIKNGVTDKPSTLAAVADSKDPKFPHQKHKRDLLNTLNCQQRAEVKRTVSRPIFR
jgi:hypothetical protein